MQHLTQKQFKKQVMAFVKKDFLLNQIVFNQMDYATNVYYVIEGTFEVMRQQEIKKVNDHNVPKELIKVSGPQSASPFKRTNFSNEKSVDKHNIKIRTLNKG